VHGWTVKARLERQLAAALETLKADGVVPVDVAPVITVTRSKEPAHGDFTTNLAMQLAKPAKRLPRDIAQAIIKALPPSDDVCDVSIAGPGFINFFQAKAALSAVIEQILQQGEAYGRSNLGMGQRVLVECVSLSPSGPLHVGHGRVVALGASISNLLLALGFDVHREYYVNDSGRQNSDLSLNSIVADSNDDLSEFGVSDNTCSSQRTLDDDVHRAIKKLDAAGHVYIREGAHWFRSIDVSDDQDRVLIRASGEHTRFSSDIAYINNAFERGFDKLLCVFGSHHHDYTAGLFAACEALGHTRDRLEFVLVQPATLNRSGKRVPMSARGESLLTLRQLRDEVGEDAARYFYVMRKSQQPLDFDLDLAKLPSLENPVYRVQYAYARICSVQRQQTQRELAFDRALGLASVGLLNEPAETNLMTLLAIYPEIIERAGLSREPQHVTGYLRDLANALHTYYNAQLVLLEDEALRSARLCLLLAVKQVLINGLTLIDVSTLEVM